MMENVSNGALNSSGTSQTINECHEILSEGVVEGTNGVLLTFVYGMSMCFILIANTALIFGLMKTSGRTYTSSTKYFLVLSVTDMSCAITFIPIQLYVIWNIIQISCTMTGMRAFFSVFPLTLSGIIIMVLTIDRYDTVKAGTQAKRSRKGYKDIITFVLIAIAVSTGWGIWYTMTTRESSFAKASVFFICLGSFEACVLLTVVVFNTLIFYRVKESSKNTSIKNKSRLAEKRLSKTILLISGTLVVTYSPSVIALLVAGQFFYNLAPKDLLVDKVTRTNVNNIAIGLIWSLLLSLINSGLNASIYMARNKRIVRMFMSMYTRKKEKIFAGNCKRFYSENSKSNLQLDKEDERAENDATLNNKHTIPMNEVKSKENDITKS